MLDFTLLRPFNIATVAPKISLNINQNHIYITLVDPAPKKEKEKTKIITEIRLYQRRQTALRLTHS